MLRSIVPIRAARSSSPEQDVVLVGPQQSRVRLGGIALRPSKAADLGRTERSAGGVALPEGQPLLA
jgi:hypothetical protein